MSDTREFARQIRKTALTMVHRAHASHIGGVLSMADLLAVLYSETLRLRPADPKWLERDRFILSKGHCCAGVYAALARCGFFPEGELETFGRDGSRLMAHISHKVPGVEFSTGSLGHGLPFACGKALAAKRQINYDRQAWRVFVLMSDGEMDEGSNWEAFCSPPITGWIIWSPLLITTNFRRWVPSVKRWGWNRWQRNCGHSAGRSARLTGMIMVKSVWHLRGCHGRPDIRVA